MAEYKGSGPEAQRASFLERARDRMIADFQLQKDKISKEGSVNIGIDKFVSRDIWADNELKKQTVGLVRLEDFQKIREGISKRQREEEAKREQADNPKKQKKARKKTVVSFDEDELVGDDARDEIAVKCKIKKNPDIDTSFLPDRERDEKEKAEKDRLRQEWTAEQDTIKAERIQITCSYWDGIGHRKVVECKKGDTIAKFLEQCSRQWTELRSVNTDDLMYVKEDLIIPQHYTFYDFIVNKVRGKSGPLFSFDVHDDVRLLNDASIETEESHAGKVIRRSWYEKNKHIFPASRWEVFDPRKEYGRYAIKNKNKQQLV